MKTAFGVGWDTSFQPQGWATSSTAALSFWGRDSKGDQKESGREPHEARIRLCERQGRALDESVWDCKHREAVLSLSLSVSGSEGDEPELRCVIVDTGEEERLERLPLQQRLDPLLRSGLCVWKRFQVAAFALCRCAD